MQVLIKKFNPIAGNSSAFQNPPWRQKIKKVATRMYVKLDGRSKSVKYLEYEMEAISLYINNNTVKYV